MDVVNMLSRNFIWKNHKGIPNKGILKIIFTFSKTLLNQTYLLNRIQFNHVIKPVPIKEISFKKYLYIQLYEHQMIRLCHPLI